MNTRILPNHICISSELIQLCATSPTAGPKYNAVQMATTNVATEIASFTKPRMNPMTMDPTMAKAMIMSIIGIEDVVSERHVTGNDGTGF